jgi:hypothetical protein
MMPRTWFVLAWLLAVACTGVGLVAGCGSSPAKAQPPLDAGDATAEGAVPEAAVDAGPDINQDPDVYPASHHPIPELDYNGGPVLHHARIVTITFTGNVHRDGYRYFDHFIVTSGWWKQTVETFCVDGGANAGCIGDGTTAAPDGGAWLPDGSTADGGDGSLDVELAYDFPGPSILDSDIQTWLGAHIQAGDFPAPDAQTLYAIFFPTSTTVSYVDQGSGQLQTSCQQFLGYHGSIAPGAPSAGTAYAVLPYCTFGIGDTFDYQTEILTTSHEFAESVTDPQVEYSTAFALNLGSDPWLNQQGIVGQGAECADMCANVSTSSEFVGGGDEPYDESGYDVTRIWSSQAAAQSMNPCQPWSATYYGAALRTSVQNIPGTATVPAHPSDGYVFVKRGQSVNVVADVFSQAPLPHDFLLYGGLPKLGAQSPSDLSAPPDLITVTFSQQQVNNGDGVVVTFSASSKSITGPYWMVIRSVLEDMAPTDYNDWPVIVWVQ